MKLSEKFEIAYWVVWCAIPAIFSIESGFSAESAITLAVLAAIGLGLGLLNFVLRRKARIRRWMNETIAFVWFVGYFLIGYPNLSRPNGERSLGPLLLLIAIALIPLVFFIALRIIQGSAPKLIRAKKAL